MHKPTKSCFMAALYGTTILVGFGALPAYAQLGSIAPPPVRQPIDENGVDVVRGDYSLSTVDLTIGGDGQRGLSQGMENVGSNWRPTTAGTINRYSSRLIVTIDGVSDSFDEVGGAFIATEGQGATLVRSNDIWIYTNRDGVVAQFQSTDNNGNPTFYGISQANAGYLTSIVQPNGGRQDFYYKIVSYCSGGFENGECPYQLKEVVRLQGVLSSNGYMLKLKYARVQT